MIEASVVSSVASTTVAANAGEDATLEFNEGEGDPNKNEKNNWKKSKIWPRSDEKKTIKRNWKEFFLKMRIKK